MASPLSLAEKLVLLYKTSRPLEFAETNGVAAISWSNRIMRQLEANESERASASSNPKQQNSPQIHQRGHWHEEDIQQPVEYTENAPYKPGEWVYWQED